MAMEMHDHMHHHDHGHAPGKAAPAAHAGDHQDHAHAAHDHTAMIADFQRRFWVSAALTVPILLLSPMIQHWLSLGTALLFPGSDYILFILSSVVFFYGGWPFLTGMADELRAAKPGMMTLIAGDHGRLPVLERGGVRRGGRAAFLRARDAKST